MHPLKPVSLSLPETEDAFDRTAYPLPQSDSPGAFQTPLWSAEKMTWMDNTEWLPLSEVVDGMTQCIEDENIKGGEILEV